MDAVFVEGMEAHFGLRRKRRSMAMRFAVV
jgi:hypothetical protein